MDININTHCSVTLTEDGANWLNKYHKKKREEYKKILSKYDSYNDYSEELYPINYQEGDIIEYSLWELMEKFGEYFTISLHAPFIKNCIHFQIIEC